MRSVILAMARSHRKQQDSSVELLLILLAVVCRDGRGLFQWDEGKAAKRHRVPNFRLGPMRFLSYQ